MELVAILKARALAMIELDAMNQGGMLRLADLVPPLVERYDFKVYPTKPEDFDPSKNGVKFQQGKYGNLLVESLTVYDGALVVDTLATTDESRHILVNVLEWGRDAFGLTYDEKQIRRWGYISNLVFKTDFPLLRHLSGPLHRLAEKTSFFTEKVFDGLVYEPTQVWVGHDPQVRKNGIASFLITHRVNTALSENIFFSEAPLPTNLHIKVLEELEVDVLKEIKGLSSSVNG